MTILNLLLTTALLAGGGWPLPGLYSYDQILADTKRVPDPEYLNILSELSESGRIVGEDFERWRNRVQWQAVGLVSHTAKETQGLQFDARFNLSMAVTRYPLWQRMPPSAAISPVSLELWQASRVKFLELICNPRMVRRLPR